MAERVVFHIGVPKSGTTYLQNVLWANAERLRQNAVLLPAQGHKDHRWGSLVVREDSRIRYRHASASGAWERIVADVAAWDGTALISHEFYGGATRDQAQRALESLAPAQVHLVVTARDPLRTLTSAWQETVKYGNTTAIDDFSLDVSESPEHVWNWRALDIAEVLGRWGDLVPPERVHVLPVPGAGSRQDSLWRRFGGLLVADPEGYEDLDAPANASIGLVECEVLRRMGPHLADLTALPRSTWVRKYLAETVLAARGGERFWPGPGRIEECRSRGRRAVQLVRDAGYDVVGELEDLLVPDELPARRAPSDVSEAEVAECTAELVATVLKDLRAATADVHAALQGVRRLERQVARAAAEPTAPSSRVRAGLRRLGAAARRYR